LHDHYRIKKSNLDLEIKEFLAKPDVSSSLAEGLELVRTVGNFAAHPKKCKNTGEILDVEEGEAECLIDTIEILLDFTYTRPALDKERRERIVSKFKKKA
jgi:hypothetical protein